MSAASNGGTELEPLVVWFEGHPEETRKVLRGCKICGGDISDPAIVSVAGVAHESEGYGITVCGKDATGPEWWWRV